MVESFGEPPRKQGTISIGNMASEESDPIEKMAFGKKRTQMSIIDGGSKRAGSRSGKHSKAGSTHKNSKTKYQLKEGEEDLGYEYKDGKRYRKIKRTVREDKLIPKEEYDEIVAAFSLFDKDKSGTMDVGELREALKVLGIFTNMQEVKDLMDKADRDGSGTIELDEFVPLMAAKFQARDQVSEI